MQHSRIILWLGLAAVVGCFTGFVATLTTWYDVGELISYHGIDLPQRYDLRRIEWRADEFKAKFGRVPTSIKELKEWCNDDQVRETDIWNHPIDYRLNGDSLVILSYGRDGRPGGVGWNYDVTPKRGIDNPKYPDYVMPLWQFAWFILDFPRLAMPILVASILGAVSSLQLIKPSQVGSIRKWRLGRLIFNIFIVILLVRFAIFVLMAK